MPQVASRLTEQNGQPTGRCPAPSSWTCHSTGVRLEDLAWRNGYLPSSTHRSLIGYTRHPTDLDASELSTTFHISAISRTRRGYPVRVRSDPFGETANRTKEILAERCKRIFDLRGLNGRDGPFYEAILLEFPQRLSQHFLADFSDVSAKRIEPARPTPQRSDYEQGPFIADPREHPAKLVADRRIFLFTRFRNGAFLFRHGNPRSLVSLGNYLT